MWKYLLLDKPADQWLAVERVYVLFTMKLWELRSLSAYMEESHIHSGTISQEGERGCIVYL